MTNCNDNNLKIKSLNELIDIYFSFEYTDTKEVVQMFHEFVDECDSLYSKTEFKKKLIPKDLFHTVAEVVERDFQGDWEAYFPTVELYFATFTFEDLTVANTFYGALYNSSDCHAKLKKYLKRQRKPKIFHACALLKLVGKGAKYYCPEGLFNEFKLDKAREQEYIRSNVIVGTDGKVMPLSVATKTAEQNIAEKLNIINTMEKIAEKKGWTWCFITLTLPPEMHPNPIMGKNSYDGTSPQDSAKYLNNKIKQVRALMAKRGIKAGRNYHGCSSAESHKDGCLHKHLLIFCHAEEVEGIRDSFSYTFNNMNEDSFRVNDGRAKASSYVFKYVMKSISHFDNNLDILSIGKDSDPLLYSTMLNNAFRSYNAIRGFSFFGIENCLSKFRFLARNLKKVNLPVVFEQLIKENNLFELLEGRYFDQVENIYVKDGENKKFVGCKINAVQFLKNFFKMTKKEAGENATEVFTEMAKLTENKVLHLLGVIVNPNYSRKPFLTELNDKLMRFENQFFDWWCKENPAIE